jgi:hypothetical protein
MRFFISLIFIALTPFTHAKVLRVNNTAGMDADYSTLAAAVNAADAGAVDTIHVEGSVTPYTGNVTVNKKVVIIGPGYFLGSTAETQYNKETAKLDCNIVFDAGSACSVLAGVVHHTGASGFTVVSIPTAYTGNRVVIQANDISIVSCKLFFLEINNVQPLSDITVQRCFFNPGVIVANGAGVVSNLTVTNCLFRNNYSAGGFAVIYSTAGKQSGWRISQNTFYNAFSVIAQNTTFTNNVFYAATATFGVVTASSTNTYTDNVMRFAVGGMVNGADRNIIPPAAVGENMWFSRTGGDMAIDIYYTSASASTDCPLRDGSDPGSDSKSKGMYGGGSPYVKSGMYAIPSVYDIAMDAEVGNSFNMIIKARTH